MELWEIEARESVRDLVARYNANGDSGRIEQMVELFAEDAVLLIAPSAEYVGRDAIQDHAAVRRATASRRLGRAGGRRLRSPHHMNRLGTRQMALHRRQIRR